MGTGRKFSKTVITRPRKNGAAKRQRQKNQSKRLVELGMDAEAVAKLNPREVRTLLNHPAKVAKANA
jgi:hypothetical protein